MATKMAVRNILPDIPITLSLVVGDIVIRFGELERVLMTAMARVESADNGRSDDKAYFLELVGKYKNIGTLGALIDKAQKLFKKQNFAWIDFQSLKRLKDQRNEIHDALVDDFDGSVMWQASSKRKHRPIDYAQLLLVRECVERTIMQINDGSLQYKKSHAGK